MGKPNLVCQNLNVTTEHPQNWSIPPVSGGVEVESLNGSTLKDIPWRKYQYVLSWEAMSKDDFEDLEDLINLHSDFGLSIAFHYERWRQTDTTIYCSGKLLARSFAAGCYQEVELTLTELDSRAMIS